MQFSTNMFLLFEFVDLAALHTTHGTRKCRHLVIATPVHRWEEQSVADTVGPLCSLSDDIYVHRMSRGMYALIRHAKAVGYWSAIGKEEMEQELRERSGADLVIIGVHLVTMLHSRYSPDCRESLVPTLFHFRLRIVFGANIVGGS
jgi:hypothetical protein